MAYRVIIIDQFEQCPGRLELGPFPTMKEAKWAAEHEMNAAAELFTDGRSKLTAVIERVR